MPAAERAADTAPTRTSAPNPTATVLQAETNALVTCLKNAVIKTGQVYAFHADTRRLGVRKYSPYPPRNLTASLGRELEKYDQLCDTIETQLLRAISVLKRDLAREERRAKEAEMAKQSASRALTTVATMLPPPPPGQNSPQGSVLPARRQSAISLSSLNRHPFPLKLDLSSSSLRMTAEDVALFSKGLVHSPVSLAPKSARPASTADMEFMAAFASAAANSGSQHVDIDLTVDDSPPSMMPGINTSLGSSADKPIELDLDGIDMEMSLFRDGPGSTSGDGQASMDELFTPPAADAAISLSTGDGPHSKDAKQDEGIGMGILDALTAEGSHEANIFAAMQASSISSAAQMNNGRHQGPQSSNVAASPRSLLASFTNHSQLDSVTPFDLSTLDFSNLGPSSMFEEQSADGGIMDMEALLSMHHTGDNSDLQRPIS